MKTKRTDFPNREAEKERMYNKRLAKWHASVGIEALRTPRVAGRRSYSLNIFYET